MTSVGNIGNKIINSDKSGNVSVDEKRHSGNGTNRKSTNEAEHARADKSPNLLKSRSNGSRDPRSSISERF